MARPSVVLAFCWMVAASSAAIAEQSTPPPQGIWEVSGGTPNDALTATVSVASSSDPSHLYQLTLRCDRKSREISLSTFTESTNVRVPRPLEGGTAAREVLYRVDLEPPKTARLVPVSSYTAQLSYILTGQNIPATRLLISGVFGSEEVDFPLTTLSDLQRRALQDMCFGKLAEAPPVPPRLGPGSGIMAPRLLREVKPSYTADAMRMQLEGVIWLAAVVLPDGTPGSIEVTKCGLKSRLQDSTDTNKEAARDALLRSSFKAGTCDHNFGLDWEAARALKHWRFLPGTKDGVPVSVLVEIEMSFRLK